MGKRRQKGIVIAIDGPVASGKSTIAKLVAQRLGYLYVDTGAMYRAMALKFLRLGIDLTDKVSLSQIANHVDIQLMTQRDGSSRVLLDGEDVTDAIRSPEVSDAASIISVIAEVRETLSSKQRKLAVQGGVVMEGRDIQTVIVPDAEVKIFLTADLEVRAKRRWLEMLQKGFNVQYDEIFQQLQQRDERDSGRPIAPLQKSIGAIEIDTTNLTPDEVCDYIVSLAIKNFSYNLEVS